ncbi:hypothetical protein [Salinarchaeum laminariae]|uniref:hypothetical protein n=1 Tax=Salinarchaeum laminariae TaxID=869888 RepID=UPI0020BE1279|nr:hypothetical protein [Salinarchaeum laminariae]
MSDTSTTFGGWSDRLTYIVGNAQLLVAGIMISIAVALLYFQPQLPGVPGWVYAAFAATLLLGPLLFGFFMTLISKLRVRNWVEVHHVNAREDVLEKYNVSPEVWAEKSVDGPNPYPVNGGSAWAVQEFEHLEDVGELRVKGVWLEEVEDVKLLSSKSHMDSIYEKLTESHIALQIMRDSVSEFGADIQKRLTNRMAEAREKGKLMDENAVSEVFDEFEGDATDVGPDDLPTLEVDETAMVDPDDLAEEALGDLEGPAPEGGEQPVAADGGSE